MNQDVFHSIVAQCSNLGSIDDFKSFIVTNFRSVFRHDIAVCGIGELHSSTKLYPCRLVRLINIDFPKGYLQRIILPTQLILSPTLEGWIRKRVPQFIQTDNTAIEVDTIWLRAVRDYKIYNIALHGMFDVNAKTIGFFAFGNLHPSAVATYKTVLTTVVPHLHSVLIRILTEQYLSEINLQMNSKNDGTANSLIEISEPNQFSLTERELQVLKWLGVGKTNWEISRIICISEFTVKNHVQNLFKKLSVTNRVQAVTRAIESGLLDMEK